MNTCSNTKNHSIKVIHFIIILLIALAPLSLQARKKYAKGIVFEDTNQNGIYDKGEYGIPGVSVSNRSDVVQTDEKGRYKLRISKETIIFVSKPAGYTVPLDKNNIPRFYYIYQPKGSPKDLDFKGIEPTGKRPKSINFPLLKGELKEDFDVIVMGDPQTKTHQELNYYRDDVISGLIGTDARFYIALGDILYDDLKLYDRMNNIIGQIGIPAYHVMGNHDMNARAKDYNHEAETFKRTYGPDYYSFTYGKVHFVILNSVKYNGWNKKEDKKGSYIGYLHEKQLNWLKNDLAVVPDDHLVVLSMHIPIDSIMFKRDSTTIVNREALFKILENRSHLLALAGHQHFVEYLEFTEKDGWNGKNLFPSLTAGAGCGTWWHGVKDPRGIPYGIGPDGTPNGYFRFSFKGNTYEYQFHPTRSLDHPQMRINSPLGILDSKNLATQEINVNVFAGSEKTKVYFSLDGNPETAMQNKIMADPFFANLIKENPNDFLEWMKPGPSSHIWVAPLPTDIKSGIHRLKIIVHDHQGNTFTAYRLFEIH
jgi:C terminal of Calcineurin-like phosphoesterase/N terminal of Calcineurin-like phosphoesterase/Calcineurin-like phosphoesterase